MPSAKRIVVSNSYPFKPFVANYYMRKDTGCPYAVLDLAAI
jgi:hypothetical protein